MPSIMWVGGRLTIIYPVEVSNDVPCCNCQERRDENPAPSFSHFKVLTLKKPKESKSKQTCSCAEVFRFWVN